MPYTHKNTEGKTKSRVPQVFTFHLFLKWQKVKTKKPAWTSCWNKMEATSKPLQPLCWELKNQNLRGEGSWQWPERAVCRRRRAQKAFWLEGIHDTKLKIWTPFTSVEGSLTPGEDDWQKPGCCAGTCLPKPVVGTGETGLPTTPGLKATRMLSWAQRAATV